MGYNRGLATDHRVRYGIDTIVETGTFNGLGTASFASGHGFGSIQGRPPRRVYTIELDPDLHATASRRFESWPNVVALRGDSAAELPRLLTNASEIHTLATSEDPVCFYLDSHYSGGGTADSENPILTEVRTVLAWVRAGDSVSGRDGDSDYTSNRRRQSVIVIDDARLFTGLNSYPTVVELQRTIVEDEGRAAAEAEAAGRTYPRKHWAVTIELDAIVVRPDPSFEHQTTHFLDVVAGVPQGATSVHRCSFTARDDLLTPRPSGSWACPS